MSQRTHAQNPIFDWVKGLAGPGQDFISGVKLDIYGNIYAVGFYNGTGNFNPGGTGGSITTAGGADIFLAKYSPTGSLIWVKSMGGSGADQGLGLTLDAFGNVFVTGIISASGADFNPGGTGGAVTSFGNTDAFIAKFSSTGDFLWVKTIGGTDADRGHKLAASSNGDIYVCGQFGANGAQFDPVVTGGTVTSLGNADAYVAKYNTNGDFLWVKTFGGLGLDISTCITVDDNDHVYVAGTTASGSANFNLGGPGGTFTGPTVDDIFIVKHDSSGAFQWAKRVGGTQPERIKEIAADMMGSIYLTGDFTGTCNFNPGGTGGSLTSSGSTDAYILKYSTSGSFEWVKKMGGTMPDIGVSVVTDGIGDIYVSGDFQGTANLDPGGSAGTVTSAFMFDVFVAKYSSAGTYIWSKGIPGGGAERNTGLAASNGKIILTGTYHTSDVDFNAGNTGGVLAQVGGSDAFIVTYSQPCQTFQTITQSACDSFNFNGQNLTLSGTYTDTLQSSQQCDSIITLNLTITGNTTINPIVQAHYCDSAVINGITYTLPGTYTQYFSNSLGCDSNITYEITLGENTTGNNLTASACDVYILNDSILFSTSGVHEVILKNAVGCDSIFLLDLTITPKPVATISEENSTLVASTADSYQWLDCDQNMAAIPGATDAAYSPEEPGNYAVIVTTDGCSDTSKCFSFDPSSINTLGTGNQVQIFPNPAGEQLNIHTQRALHHGHLRITNISGQILLEQKLPIARSFLVDMKQFAAGLYIVELTDDKASLRVKINKL